MGGILMKKLLSFILAAALLSVSSIPALAANLPARAAEVIQEAGWEGYKAAAVYTKGPPGMVYALMRKGDQNLLCVLEHDSQNKEYRLLAANENFLPPGNITPKFTYHDFVGEFYIEYSVKKPASGQPAKVVLQFFDDGVNLRYAELTYPAGWDRLFLQDIITPYGDGTYSLTRVKVDKRGDYAESVDTLYIERAGWVYNLPSFSLEQALSDIAFARRRGGGGPRPLLVPVPAELTAGAEAGDLIQFDDLFISVNATSVRLPSRGLTDIAALAELPALEELHLVNNQIADLRPLAGLVNLRTLNIRNNQVEDLGPLAGLKQLKKLQADGNPIKDLAPVAKCAALEELDASGGNTTDLSPLAGLEKLRQLRLNASGLAGSDLRPLAALSALNELALENNQIADLGPLEGCKALTALSLGKNHIADLEPFRELTKLESLSLTGNQITALEPLSGLLKLRDLALNGNAPADLSPLYGLTGLSTLYLDPDTDTGQLKELKSELKNCEIILEAVQEEKPETFESGSWKYYLLEGGAVLAGYTEKPGGKLQVPEELDGHRVTRIGERAFYESALKSVTIPEGVTLIGDKAFSNCSGLTAVEMPDSVTRIGSSAFEYTSKLRDLSLSKGLLSIGGGAFNGSAVKNLLIPGSVVEIDGNPFAGSYDLRGFDVEAHSPAFESVGGVLFNKGRQELIAYPAKLPKGAVYEIPQGVASIGQDAFSKCENLKGVTIPNSVTSIGPLAFSWCKSLTGVTIPDSVTVIGARAFSGCSSLASVTLPNNETVIGGGAFWMCSALTIITIPGGMRNVSSWAFNNYGDTSAGGLKEVTILPGVTSIDEGAFRACRALTSVTIPSSVTSIGNEAFGLCESLKAVTIPDGVTHIGNKSFIRCFGLTSVTIPDSVTYIGSDAFAFCTKLAALTIPAGVTHIGDDAFVNCGIAGKPFDTSGMLFILSVTRGSYPEQYAKENGIAYIFEGE